MKSCMRIGNAAVLLLSMAALAYAVSGGYDWRWGLPQSQHEDQNYDISLTDRNGSRAADMWSIATSDVDARAIFEAGGNIQVLSVDNGDVYRVAQPYSGAEGERPCLVISTGRVYVGALWFGTNGDSVRYGKADWPDDWNYFDTLSDGAYNAALAIGTGYTLGEVPAPYTYACYRADPTGGTDGVWFRTCYGSEQTWIEPVQISTDPADQITVFPENPLGPIIAYHYKDGETHKIKVWKSSNCGYIDTWEEVEFDPPLENVAQPCIALSDDGYYAAMCWVRASEGEDPTVGGKVEVCWSDDFFYSHNGPVTVGAYSSDPELVYSAPSMSLVPTSASPYHSNLVIVSELAKYGDGSQPARWLSATSGLVGDDDILWHGFEHYMPWPANVADENANPCVDACKPYEQHPKACCFYTAAGAAHRALYRLDADYVPNSLPFPPIHFDGVGRRIWLDPSGVVTYAARAGTNVHAGPVLEDNSLQPVLVSGGGLPALALDGDDGEWIAYICDETVWVRTDDGNYEVVFAGSSSAAPGQPSIITYPNQANGVYAAGLVFPVYDTAGGTSRIMFARACTSGVILDTIESVQNLGDSLPCLSVYRNDTLICTWQHGTDSVLASMLCDYGPGTSGQPPAWSSPNLVTANGYHSMSRFDDNGTVLNVVWSRNNGSNYAVQRATCDLATTAFGNWSQMATPGDTGSYEKANPVFGGLGVSCWQQKDAGGTWTIKGFVRGEETTFVANDTDAYHPHCVAESSAISPSIDEIRAHILYTAGVVFEVDSGLFDTGETRYVCCSLDLSNATSDATKANNGAKLLRKNGLDSLFSVYSDLDNAVVFAWSANGDTWQRSVVASGRDYPAIAEDSSGKRWVVTRKPSQTMNPPIQEAYYRNGSSWTGPETLYAVSGTTLGPASLSGSSYTTSGIGYAAFLSTANGGTKSLILAKFNGSVVSTYTVATGSSLGDPALTVEPYKSDSDRIHITWEDGTIKYRMDTDGRSTSIASNWTSTYSLTDGQSPAHHPCISADHDQIVAAWAQGITADIYSRKRSTASAYNSWDAAVNLSNTGSYASDYPTIAMGDTVVVAWEETRSGNDHDIMVCINFSDTLNIADNSTVSGYPHVLFYNKASGDTAIPYLHTIWSESPEAEYYEVGYNKLNLKHPTGEGQQSASSISIPVKPELASCSPNPFRSHTRISYALPTAGNVSLRVYDVTGRTVRTLASGHQKAGSYSVGWDARDSHGKQVPYGVYFYRLDTPGFRSVKKAVVAR